MGIGHRDAGDVPVDAEGLNLEKLRSDNTLETVGLEGDDNKDVGGGCEGIDPSGPQPVVSKCLEDSTTSSCHENKPSSNDDGQETALQASSLDQPLQHTESMPIKSALKGSREKMGKATNQLSVSWAPEVYDPVPNSLCHTVKSSSKKKSRKDKDSKRSGKKGQKGNSSSSRGSSSSSKDKKQSRRKPSKSSYKALDIDEDVGFEVASQDYCGSSFLKQSVTEFHYPVAEAL
ncbi:hypothetical protein LINGRAHAP2_LOCUS35468 [Linum grandiflorum]